MAFDLGGIIIRGAQRSVCSYDELLSLATWWLISERRLKKEFEYAMDTYTTLRSQGHTSGESRMYLRAIYILNREYTIGPEDNSSKVIKENVRLIRDE